MKGIADEALLNEFRGRDCEICPRRNCSEPHHVFARGLGGGSRVDHRFNLLACCRLCHSAIENGSIRKSAVLAIVATREGITVATLRETVYRLIRSLTERDTGKCRPRQVTGTTCSIDRDIGNKPSEQSEA
jgi:hypothetical protein